MKEYIYFSPYYGGCTGVLTVHSDGHLEFETSWQSGPVLLMPEEWFGGRYNWKRICEL